MICQRKQVGSNGAIIGMLDARKVKRARDKVTGSRVRRRRRLNRVKRAAIVFRGMILVAAVWVRKMPIEETWRFTHRLPGS